MFASKQYKVVLFGNWLIRDVSNQIFIDIIVNKIAINHINTFLRYNFNNLSEILILGVPETFSISRPLFTEIQWPMFNFLFLTG